jgi:hypothetical protein
MHLIISKARLYFGSTPDLTPGSTSFRLSMRTPGCAASENADPASENAARSSLGRRWTVR